MRVYALISALEQEPEVFLQFFRGVLEDHIAKASSVCGYTDEKFVKAVRKMFDDPDILFLLSEEHRVAIGVAYVKARAEWDKTLHV